MIGLQSASITLLVGFVGPVPIKTMGRTAIGRLKLFGTGIGSSNSNSSKVTNGVLFSDIVSYEPTVNTRKRCEYSTVLVVKIQNLFQRFASLNAYWSNLFYSNRIYCTQFECICIINYNTDTRSRAYAWYYSKILRFANNTMCASRIISLLFNKDSKSTIFPI